MTPTVTPRIGAAEIRQGLRIGSVFEPVEPAGLSGALMNPADAREIEITMVGATATDDAIAAASYGFRTEHHGRQAKLRPATVRTRQIRSARKIRPVAE